MKPLKQFEFTQVLGWSVTRYDQFTLCQRQYFYNYYWKFDTDVSPEYLFSLKRMTSIPLEIGNIVHDVIKVLLERIKVTTQPINRKRFLDYTRRKTEEYCKEKTFSEVYYKEKDRIDIDALHRKVVQSMDNLLSSFRYRWLVSEAVAQKNEWIIEPPGFGETRIDGMKAYCKVDFLFPMKDKLVIIDWKTGKPSAIKHKKQLTGYAAWASYHFEHDPSKIELVTAHLYPEYEERPMTVNEFDIQEFALRIREETAAMQAMCVDVENNVPKEKKAFRQTTNPRICRYCNFRELCGR